MKWIKRFFDHKKCYVCKIYPTEDMAHSDNYCAFCYSKYLLKGYPLPNQPERLSEKTSKEDAIV